jgi:hypothetical protein
MRSLGMAFFVAETLLGSILMGRRRGVRRWWAMAGYVASADAVTSALVAMLSPKGQRENERKGEGPEN